MSTPTPPIPRRRGRPRNDDLADVRLRNLRWLWLALYDRLTVAQIAAAEGYSPPTIRAGLRAARGYGRRREELAA